jgi:ribosomal-protein-alanine N-acetyltransferase
LRLFGEPDFASLRELDSEPAVLRHRTRPVITPEMTREFLDLARQSVLEDPRTFYAYAIERKPGRDSSAKTWLGQCGMAAIPEKHIREKSVYLYYSLLPRYWGYGYMTEAVQALIQLGFDKFGLSAISAESNPENIASYRVMEKAGLDYTGKVHRLDDQGNSHERVHYELTCPEFMKKSWPPVHISDPV